MIVSWIVQGITDLLGWILELLPHWTMPSWLAGNVAFPPSVAGSIGSVLHAVAPYFPVQWLLQIIQDIMTAWTAFIAFLIFQWVWNHVPSIAGFGPNSSS